MVSGDSALISEALIVWTGRGRSAWPERDDGRVVAEFGAEQAAVLLPQIRALADDFYASDARDRIADLAEMGDVAAEEFRDRHPDLPADVSEALAWCYTFDNK